MPDQTQTTYSQVAPVKGRWPLGQRGSKIFKPLAIITIAALLGLTALFLSGFLSAFSANIVNQAGVTYFDPLITLTYLVYFYFLNSLFSFTNKQRSYYFLLTLLLSFTVNFVEGSILLLVLFPTLRKLKLIETSI